MAIMGSTPLLNEKEGEASSSPQSASGASGEGWRPAAIATDIATLGTATLLAGVFNVALVFVVPRLISVEDYGYWRMFGLYAGYVGFLHFGFADGALLRWAGRPWEEVRQEVAPAVKYLVWQHVLVLLPLFVIAALALRGPLRLVAIAVFIFAPLYNVTATLQFGLQGARIFQPVAIATAAAAALMPAFVLIWASRWQSNLREILVLYLLAWCLQLAFLLAWTKPWKSVALRSSATALAKGCVLSGWPIVLANTGMNLIQTADRLAASWAVTIQSFAQYSLAASAMAVPITFIQACSQVLFSHLAGVTPAERKRIYGASSRTMLIVWAILLPYYFALEIFVRRFLPRYVASLQYARVLLLGIPFLAVIQILQMSYAYLNGRQRHFLVQTVAVLAVSLGATSFAAFHTGSLQVVAGVQVSILGAWWLFNEWVLRGLTGQTAGDWIRFGGVYLSAGTSYWMATAWGRGATVCTLAYYLCLSIVVVALCREELRVWMSLIARHSRRYSDSHT